MSKVWTAQVTTESQDRYTYVYANKPTREQVIEKVWLDEGEIESLEWYQSTTSVYIEETQVNQH